MLFAVLVLASQPYQPKQKTDALVVLTGGDGRIEEGFRLWKDGLSANIFISGVHPDVSRDTILSKWTHSDTLPKCCLEIDNKATTTMENAIETEKWVQAQGVRSIRLITADFHMNRALIELKQTIPNVKILPHPVSSSEAQIERSWFWYMIFIEYNKILYRLVQLAIFPPTNEHAGHDG